MLPQLQTNRTVCMCVCVYTCWLNSFKIFHPFNVAELYM